MPNTGLPPLDTVSEPAIAGEGVISIRVTGFRRPDRPSAQPRMNDVRVGSRNSIAVYRIGRNRRKLVFGRYSTEADAVAGADPIAGEAASCAGSASESRFRRSSRDPQCLPRLLADSPLEETGFELSVLPDRRGGNLRCG
jgi:hypothetical protein